MKRILTAASALAAAALALTACAGGGAPGGGTPGGDAAAAIPSELNIANFLDLVSWDPSVADIGFNGPYLSAVYDPLVALNGDGEPVPALATDWNVAADALTVTLNLRDDATFSNGEAFNADVAVTNLEFLKEGVTSREAYLNVDRFEAIDDDTVEIHMNKRDDRLLYFMGLGRSYMAAPEAIEAGTLVEAPVGSGPYTLSDTTIPGAEYHFDRVTGHWAEDEFPFDTVSVLPLQDPSARNNAMESGQINVAFADATALELAEQNNWNVAEKVAAWSGIRINDHTGDQLKPLGDARVRRALNLAFDGQAMLDAVGNGLGVYTNQVFAAGYPGYDEALNRPRWRQH